MTSSRAAGAHARSRGGAEAGVQGVLDRAYRWLDPLCVPVVMDREPQAHLARPPGDFQRAGLTPTLEVPVRGTGVLRQPATQGGSETGGFSGLLDGLVDIGKVSGRGDFDFDLLHLPSADPVTADR